jgi:hypothetical protein
MSGWADGDLAEEFEERLDDLLAVLCPDWEAPELPEQSPSDLIFIAYERLNAKRMKLGDQLSARPEVGAALGGRVLEAIACDEDVSFNKQLVHPMLAALGRRAVQHHLISVVETGPEHKKVCAVRAWYWSQVSLVYTSDEAFQARRPTQRSHAADDEVADLRVLYRIACLNAFVTCRQPSTQEWLANGFILKDEYYPADLHGVLAQARTIAEADPDRYKKLIAKEPDGTSLGRLGSRDPG